MKKNSVNGIMAIAAATTLACSLGITAEATTQVQVTSDGGMVSYTEDNERRESFPIVQGEYSIKQIGSHYYYISSVTGEYVTGFFTYGNGIYFADENGYLAEKGFKNIYDPATGTTNTYYFNENHTAATGFLRLDERLYYFNESGQMQFGYFQTYKGWCYAKETGKLVCDDSVKVPGGAYLCFDSDGIQIN